MQLCSGLWRITGREAGLKRRIFLKYAELFEAKYVGKYAEFGKNMQLHHICGIFFHMLPAYATSSDGES